MIEILEQRIAPATLIGARTVRYADIDGDEVTVTFSRDVFTGTPEARLAKANEVFMFDPVGVASGLTTGGQVLRLLDFTKFPAFASTGSTVNGVGVTITAVSFGGGDGFVDVGAIKAVGVSLGAVVIDGDLGQIDAGGSRLTIGLASLTVESLGERGIVTQKQVATPTADNPAPDLISTITGELTSLRVLTDIARAQIRVVDGRDAAQNLTTLAKIGTVTIEGSLLGRLEMQSASDETGSIKCAGDIGTVLIKGNIVGGGGVDSGRISAGGSLGSITVEGDLKGGAGRNSGSLFSAGSMKAVRIDGDFAGAAGENSATLRTFGNIAKLTIGDDLVAGAGFESASVRALGRITSTIVGGDLDATFATAGARTAHIFANGLTTVTVHGLLGGAGAQSAAIESGFDLGTVTIAGSIAGGAGDGSGSVAAHSTLKKILVAGSVLGGDGVQSGAIISGLEPLLPGTLASAKIAGVIKGGAGNDSGVVISHGSLGSLTVGSTAAPLADAIEGGGGVNSGGVFAGGKLTTLKVIGNVRGGAGAGSGMVVVEDRTDVNGVVPGLLKTLSISGGLLGGVADGSGQIRTDAGITTASLGSLAGGGGAVSGAIFTGLGTAGLGNVGRISIAGTWSQAASSPGLDSATISVGGRLSALSVRGDMTGGTLRVGESATSLIFYGNVTDAEVSAFGQTNQSATKDVALGLLDIRKNVVGSQFLAGYNLSGVAANPDAQIGKVKVGGAWAASDLVAGVQAGTDLGFGNEGDARASGLDNAGIVSRIASISIAGTVTGAAGGSTGFVAQVIAKARFGGLAQVLNGLADGQVILVGDGVTIREIAVGS